MAHIEDDDFFCDFLLYLIDQVPRHENGRAKVRRIRDMIRELSHVSFKLDPKAFYDYEFIPNGIRKASGGNYQFDQTPLFKDTFHEIAIMSPLRKKRTRILSMIRRHGNGNA